MEGRREETMLKIFSQKYLSAQRNHSLKRWRHFPMPGVLQPSELTVTTKKDLNFLKLKEQNSAMAKGHENCL